MTWFNFSGCEDNEGGDRRRVRCVEDGLVGGDTEVLKSDSMSNVTNGAIVMSEAEEKSLERSDRVCCLIRF